MRTYTPEQLARRRDRYRTDPVYRERVLAGQRAATKTPAGRKTRKEWLAKPETKLKYATWVLRKNYGITLQDKEDMFDKQNRACAACGSPHQGTTRGWHIDHDHGTGKVRGILCHPCNVALGHVKDSPERLRALIAYLEAHNE